MFDQSHATHQSKQVTKVQGDGGVWPQWAKSTGGGGVAFNIVQNILGFPGDVIPYQS